MIGWFKRIGVGLALVGIAFSSGLHVAAVQGYAWVRMYQEYREVLPAVSALEAALSGKELCGVCLAAQEIQKRSDAALSAIAKSIRPALLIDAALLEPVVRMPSARGESFAVFSELGSRLIDPIEPPPPRAKA